jgi:cell division protein FtsQ
MPVSAPADKRFRRAHVRPTRQTPWRRRLLRLAVGSALVVALLFGLFGAVSYALSSKRLTIRRIVVSGNSRVPAGDVRAILHDLIGANVITADLRASRRKVSELPWVADVEVRRVLPASIAVSLAERRAVMLGRVGVEQYLLDATGFPIVQFGPDYAQLDLPIVNGLDAGGPMKIDEQRAALAAQVIAALTPRPDLANRVSEIDVRDPRNVALLLRDDTAVVRVGTDRFLERLQVYVELARAVHERVADIDYVDLRYALRLRRGGRPPALIVRPFHVERASLRRGNKGD